MWIIVKSSYRIIFNEKILDVRHVSCVAAKFRRLPCLGVTLVGVDEDGEVETEVDLETKAGTEWDKADFFKIFLPVCCTTDAQVRHIHCVAWKRVF